MRILSVEAEPFHRLSFVHADSTGAVAGALPFYRAVVNGLPDTLDAIVVTSDLQGVVRDGMTTLSLGEAVACALESLQRGGQFPGHERSAVLLAGDLHAGAGDADVLPVWRAMARTARWVAGVAGNHDRIGPHATREGDLVALAPDDAHFLDGSMTALDGLRIGGVSGIIGSGGASGPWCRSDTGYVAALRSVLEMSCDLVLLHDGPNVAGTNLPGWPTVRQTLERGPRTLVIRGHDHWPIPLAELANGTQVLNAEGRVIVLQAPGDAQDVRRMGWAR